MTEATWDEHRARGGNAPISIVLADDTEDLRLLLKMILESSGYFRVVAEAGDGAQAIDAVSRAQPDMVLLDLAMPVMDGLEALPEIRRKAPHARIVVLSGFSAKKMADEALTLGAQAYLEKGLSPAEIVRRLLDVMPPPPSGRALPEVPGLRSVDAPNPPSPGGDHPDTPLQAFGRAAAA